MIASSANRRQQMIGLALFLCGVIFTIIAVGILGRSADLLSRKRATALTVGTTLPSLSSSLSLLRATVAAERLFTEQSLLSQEELASAYVFPERSPVPRFVSAIQRIAAAIGHSSTGLGSNATMRSGLTVDSTTFGSPSATENGVRRYPGRIVLRGTEQDSARFLGILGLSGKSLVRDVLSPQASQSFLQLVSQSAPLALKDAVHLHYTDLMTYAAAPETVEQQAYRDLPASVVPDARVLLLQGGLAQVRASLGDIASALRRSDTWPLPLLTVDHVERSGDRWIVDVTLLGRGK